MGQDTLKEYHDELIGRLCKWGELIDFAAPGSPDAVKDWHPFVAEMQAALDALRDQNRAPSPGKPLEGQPVEK